MKATVYRVADPGWHVGANCISGYRIGWYLVVWRWCLSLVTRPPENVEEPT